MAFKGGGQCGVLGWGTGDPSCSPWEEDFCPQGAQAERQFSTAAHLGLGPGGGLSGTVDPLTSSKHCTGAGRGGLPGGSRQLKTFLPQGPWGPCVSLGEGWLSDGGRPLRAEVGLGMGSEPPQPHGGQPRDPGGIRGHSRRYGDVPCRVCGLNASPRLGQRAQGFQLSRLHRLGKEPAVAGRWRLCEPRTWGCWEDGALEVDSSSSSARPAPPSSGLPGTYLRGPCLGVHPGCNCRLQALGSGGHLPPLQPPASPPATSSFSDYRTPT